jgi:hypothetical protein
MFLICDLPHEQTSMPREFVFMGRAASGLGGVFLHLDARRNWYRLFNVAIDGFDVDVIAAGQRAAFEAAGLTQLETA